MAIFAIHCTDKAGSLDLRMATRPAHLAYMAEQGAVVKLAGPMIDPEGNMAGSLLIVDMDDLAAAEALSANDPYRLAGLFDHVHITGLRVTVGALP